MSQTLSELEPEWLAKTYNALGLALDDPEKQSDNKVSIEAKLQDYVAGIAEDEDESVRPKLD